ncbi:hypothetical protein ACFQ1S_03670 [Kibdelosporangium lantanae]|uniref:DUF1707 domain-containing protein n=1 Tax=Kibdelosporangium lantanae TaxID=1497396 RepID=A0ABW3M6Z6_9PSEU
MEFDAIETLAWRFDAGELSGDEYLQCVDRERAISLPPTALDTPPVPAQLHGQAQD